MPRSVNPGTASKSCRGDSVGVTPPCAAEVMAIVPPSPNTTIREADGRIGVTAVIGLLDDY
jgi:hypothetical protein